MVIIPYTKIDLSSAVKSLLALCVLLLFSMSSMAASIQVRTDRNPVSLNESFQLVYESSDSVDDDPDFSPLEKYLDILNRNQSSNISIVNGQYNSSRTWTLSVMAKQTGELTLPPIAFGSDRSPSYTLTVKEAPANAAVQSEFYSRIRVDQEQVYAQQQLVVTQQLFSAQNLSAYGMGDLSFNGMDVISQSLGDEKQYKTRIGNRAYLVIERSYAIYPQSSGLLKIQPVLAEARTGSAASSFFDTFGRNKVLRARSNELSIAVLPVPANINVNPWLPAKDFQIQEQWPQSLPAFVQGEPLTRTLSIKADGLTAAQLPVLPELAIDGLKQYPDQPLLNDVKNDSGISGYRVEKVALIPTRPGEITLPAIEIPWWNTQTQTREVARIPARTIPVQPAPLAAPSAPVAPAPAPLAKSIAQAEAQVEPSKKAEPVIQPAGLNRWLILSILFGLGWAGTALAWFMKARRKNKAADKPSVVTTPSVKSMYKQLKSACTNKDTAECRAGLLNWAKAYYANNDIQSIGDVIQRLPETITGEIKNLDALLYGGQQLEIDFNLIADQIRQLMQHERNQSTDKGVDLLEPLYR